MTSIGCWQSPTGFSVLHQGRMIADGKPAAGPPPIPMWSRPILGTAQRRHTGAASRSVESASRIAQRPRALLEVRTVSGGYGGSNRFSMRSILTVHAGGSRSRCSDATAVGKTTLLRSISGTLPISHGDIDFRTASRWRASSLMRLIAFGHRTSFPEGRRLFPNLTVTENLQLAARPGGPETSRPCSSCFPAPCGNAAPPRRRSLSGGERQMVAIATRPHDSEQARSPR